MTTVLPDTEREQLGDALRGVEGWLTEEESQTLYGLARACSGRGAIVELGSWKGRSTVSLALGSKAGAGAPVYAIDRPRGEIYADFERNIRAVSGGGGLIPGIAEGAAGLANVPDLTPVANTGRSADLDSIATAVPQPRSTRCSKTSRTAASAGPTVWIL